MPISDKSDKSDKFDKNFNKGTENNQEKLENNQKKIDNIQKNLLEQISLLINNEKKREAVFKLYCLNSIPNRILEKEYMIYFNVDDCVYIPNISDFIQLKNLNNEKQNFWNMFLNKYPGYDEKYFKLIYKQLNSVRINFDEYLNIDNVSKEEFDELAKIALPNIEQSIIDKYKNWIYSFKKFDDY